MPGYNPLDISGVLSSFTGGGSGGSDIMSSAATGATLGSVIPGLGTAVGAGAGALMGILKGGMQGLQANKAGRAANSLQPSLYDPQQLALLDEIRQKRQSVLSGSAYAGAMGAIDQTTAGTNQAITQAGGGDVAGTMQALLSAQMNAGRAKNQVLGQSSQENQFYTGLGMDLQNRISSRAMELQLAMQAQKRAEWAQGKQDSFGNMAAGAALTDPASIDLMDILQRSSQASGNKLSLLQEDVVDLPDASSSSSIPEVGAPGNPLLELVA